MNISPIILVILAWSLTAIFQIMSAPTLIRLFHHKLSDAGWGTSRVIGWLLVSLIIWFTAHLGIPTNTTFGFWIIIIILTSLSLYSSRSKFPTLIEHLKSRKWLIITEEILFLAGMIYLTTVRSFNPKILDLEKFMDAGFMASYLRSATLPAPDIWLAGSTINYYSFGHFMGSIMTRLWTVPIAYSYNLLLGFIMGLSLMLSFSIITNLLGQTKPTASPRSLLFGGLLGSLLVNIGGNTHTIWYILKNGNWQGYWYADATRFIHNTIHEFPSYSYVVSDLHAHVWSLPLVLTFILVCLLWVKEIIIDAPATFSLTTPRLQIDLSFTKLKQSAINIPTYLVASIGVGIFIGTFVMTSAWDALIYALFLGIIGILLIITVPQLIYRLLASAALTVASAGLIALPWVLSFTSISEGIAWVTERSPLWQLFALWTNHTLLSLGALICVLFLAGKITKLKHQSSLILVAAIVFTAWVLLALPEVFYVKDIYTGHPRANTMFKFTYQAFILMSLTGGWLLGTALSQKLFNKIIQITLIVLILFITSLNLIFPYFSYRDYYGSLRDYQGIDGYAWLRQEAPDDYAGIEWMQQHIKGQPVILEAVGESYTTFDRVSSITGLPTVLGWRVHEWLWRGGFDIPGQRTEEVRKMFEAPLSSEALGFFDQYKVEYIFIGTKEYEAYPTLKLADLQKLGDVVFTQGQTTIIRRSTSQS